MPPKRPPPQSSYRNGVGSIALITGIVALVFAFVPIIGDLVTVPTGIVAVTCGWVGFNRADRGGSRRITAKRSRVSPWAPRRCSSSSSCSSRRMLPVAERPQVRPANPLRAVIIR